MVNELLNLTAIQTGNFTLKRTPVDIGAILKEAGGDVHGEGRGEADHRDGVHGRRRG